MRPVWQDAADEAHPAPTRRFTGVLVLVVDVVELTGRVTRDIRSGRTGYAWVIDGNGIFLHHQEAIFTGKNAFEARTAKMPTISFARINEIQKTLMLAGKEGTSWYISGWHLGVEGKLRKLIAYAPIRITDEEGGPLWSVAVVAPISEVEGAIHAIQVRGLLLQAAIIVVFVLGTVIIISLMARWSADLEREVAHQTAEFKKSEQRYRSLVENAGDVIFTADRAGNILSINAYGAKVLRKPAAEIVGRNLSDIFACPTAEEPLLAINEVFENKKGHQLTHLVKIDERELWLNTSFRRLLDEQGQIYAVLGISRNITDQRQIEEQNYHTEKLASLGTLSAGVAHEINNPLTVILGFTDLLLEKAEKGSETEEVLRTIESYGNKAKKVVENLLTFARRKEHSEDEVDVNACLEAVLAVLGNYLLVNRISISSHALLADLPAVRGDADELQQVFLNIINNAVYAMKAEGGGELGVETRLGEGGTCVEVLISDTGAGIPPEVRSRIFDPLFTTKKVGEGTGLGLSVSYGIVARHAGTIAVETATAAEASRTGTTFIITLPAVRRGTPGIGKGRRQMAARILAVDDEPGMLKLLAMIIREKTPHAVETSNNPIEAVQIVRRGGIDLVIADLKMPGLDGSELLEAIRAFSEIPVIIITAYGTEEAAAETREKGVFDFILKPFRKEQIVLGIERALAWSALQRENRALKEQLQPPPAV